MSLLKKSPSRPMTRAVAGCTLPIVVQAYLRLILFDLFWGRRDFGKLYEEVRSYPCRKAIRNDETITLVCSAVDAACLWYWKEVLCLQYAVVTTHLLRANGVRAELVVGVQQVPFKAHAWVEVEGRVVSDKPYVKEIYTVLDRC